MDSDRLVLMNTRDFINAMLEWKHIPLQHRPEALELVISLERLIYETKHSHN